MSNSTGAMCDATRDETSGRDLRTDLRTRPEDGVRGRDLATGSEDETSNGTGNGMENAMGDGMDSGAADGMSKAMGDAMDTGAKNTGDRMSTGMCTRVGRAVPVAQAPGPAPRRRTVTGARVVRRAVRLLRRITVARIPVRDAGMTTAEYAMGMIVAVALAGVLYKVVTGPAVSSMLKGVVERALGAQF